MALKKAASTGAPLRRIQAREYPRDLDGLCAQLVDTDPALRRWAARDLAEHPAAALRLAARLSDEVDASVRAALFSSLARVGGGAVVDAMLDLLRSEDPALRNGAIEVLAGLPDDVAPRLDALLDDADSDVRILGVNLMGQLSHPRVPQWLTRVLESEPQANVVGAALDVLAEVGGPELEAALRRTRSRFPDDPFIGFAVDLALQRIATP